MELKGGRQTSLSFSTSEEKQIAKLIIGMTHRREPLASLVMPDDVTGHGEFVEKLGGAALWLSYGAIVEK
jgi:hypothetical protein